MCKEKFKQDNLKIEQFIQDNLKKTIYFKASTPFTQVLFIILLRWGALKKVNLIYWKFKLPLVLTILQCQFVYITIFFL